MLKPFDFHKKQPPQTFQQMLLRIGMLGMAAFALGGIVIIFLFMSKGDRKEPWKWENRDIRRNFSPVYSEEENERRFREEINKAKNAFGFADEEKQNKPPANKEETRLPGESAEPPRQPPPDAPPPGDPTIPRDARDAKLNEALTKGPWVKIEDEVAHVPTFQPFQDWRPEFRSRVKSEFDANNGRQAPPNEQLALRILGKLPAKGKPGREAFEAKIEKERYWFGVGKDAVNFYRGRAFEAEGRLFDFCEVKLEPPVLMADGSKVDHYYEAVVAFLRDGPGFEELPVMQQQVLLHMLHCPDNLKAYLNAGKEVRHEDKLARESVFVKFSGVYLRQFVYSKPVAPFDDPKVSIENRAFCQAYLPLLLCADVEQVSRDGYALSEKLLQQVRDSMREDIAYTQDEAAYYATLAQANNKDDKPKVVPEIKYFDLANLETGPKYRGQGIHVYGLIGDNYAPVLLPPNISGLRRVFRCYVADGGVDLNTPNRWLVDMIELPPGLEARAPVVFDARYYRNVFEAQNNTSVVRPLLVVHHVERHYTSDTSQDWIFAVVLMAGAFVMFGGLVWFLFSDRRSVSRFEQQNMARLRERMEKHGGLKLKPLPSAKPEGGAPPPKPDATQSTPVDPPAPPANPPEQPPV